ncbi:MAG: agmatinase [Myxococcales bacterium]|nr:agmatinase [Myxococcales bacterium]MDD9969842.1 agmatinase [Myxococcales bacterium]
MNDDHERFRPASTRVSPRFAGVPTFLRLPQHDDPADVDVLICGAPFDGGTTYRPGARFGPRGVRTASALTRGFHPDTRVDVFSALRCADGGDVGCIPMDLDRSLAAIEERALSIAQAQACPIFVGGDHTISLAPLRALSKVFGPLGLVHFDAHSDTFGPAWDVDVHHGTVFRHALEEGLLRARDVVQIGIRGPFTSPDDLDYARSAGFRIIGMDEIREDIAAVERHIEALSECGPFYVSFDMDAVDPVFAPGTGTPVPGGLNSYEALRLVRACRHVKIVGGDAVEISPDHDPSGNTTLLAATLIAELLAAIGYRRGEPDTTC